MLSVLSLLSEDTWEAGAVFLSSVTSRLRLKWSRAVVSDSATPWTVAHQALRSMGFSRQEYWSGVPFPSPGDLSGPGIQPRSSMLQAEALPSEPPGVRLRLPEGK